ncbi:MAG: hypothetical protein AB9869_24670 [Verrucomicrobiia bacterium]
MRTTLAFLIAAQVAVQASLCLCRSEGAALRVAAVIPAPDQPALRDNAAVIFYDDFDQLPEWRSRYFEYSPAKEIFVWTEREGLRGGAMRCQFDQGQVTAGSLKVLFGRNPFGRGVRFDQTFQEIYWRVYVKHEPGWQGNPAKLARATCLAGKDWSQGFIAHVWGGKGDVLCIDPATGIRDSRKVTTRYNDFSNLKWLGLRQGQTPIFIPTESGRWVCVESHVKLNAPGKRDGVFELWVDGKLEASRTDLDWHGEWTEYGINAVFLENYWNQGSTKKQARWFDDFVISTEPIGPFEALKPPTLVRTEPATITAWEAEIAADPNGADIVWKSQAVDGRRLNLVVDQAHGAFSGSRVSEGALEAGTTHWVRVREAGQTHWSPWHAPFR